MVDAMAHVIDVVTWTIATIDKDRWPELRACLSTDESTRADRFAHRKDQELYTAAHFLLRQVLSAHGARAPDDWRFAVGDHGKPYLIDNGDDLRFNLTHTTGLVAVAVAKGVELGIDAEWLDRRSPNLNIADHRFSPDEIAWLRSLAADAQQDGFLRLWTAKEAFLKSTGKGLTQALSTFSVRFDPPTITAAAKTASPMRPVQLFEFQPTDRHLLALIALDAATPVQAKIRAYE
jgi:4'-phosphopantetheinyl transferase